MIAHLALYFGPHTLFARVTSHQGGPLNVALPHLESVRWDAVAVTVLACVLVLRVRLSVLCSLAACSVAGAVLYLVSY